MTKSAAEERGAGPGEAASIDGVLIDDRSVAEADRVGRKMLAGLEDE